MLVTGGAGYIGAHTCKALAAAGCKPIVVDNLALGKREAVRWGPLIVGDIADGELIGDVMRRYDVDAVMHFAGLASVSESVSNPDLYYRNNVAGSISLLDAMRRAGVRSIVFSSTCAVYGAPARLPVGEDAPLAPINPYGSSKHIVEQALQYESTAHGLRYAALRYFNAAGADLEGMIGGCRSDSPQLIPRALLAAAGESKQLEIYGDDYSTPDGTCIRDYIHVTDIARGHLHALDYLAEGGPSAAVNLGTGQGMSVLEVLASVERITGRRLRTVKMPRRVGDPPVLIADTQTASRLFGFTAQYSDIDTIVGTAWRFRERTIGER